jgi:hypothetical protein
MLVRISRQNYQLGKNKSMTAMKSFIVKTSIHSDEFLLSYLIRLSQANCYDSFTTFKNVINETLHDQAIQDSLDSPRQSGTYKILSIMCGLPEKFLIEHTIHKYAPILMSYSDKKEMVEIADNRMMPLVDREIAERNFRVSTQVAYCPHCLGESAYDRLSWHLLTSTVCLKHNCLLVDSCPECGSKFTTSDLINGYCPKCNCDLRKVITNSVENDTNTIRTQKVLNGLLGIDQQEDLIPEIPNQVLFHFYTGLRTSILIRPDFVYFHPSPISNYTNVNLRSSLKWKPDCQILNWVNVTAIMAMSDFPNGLYRFFDEFRKYKEIKKISLGLGTLYWHWFEDFWLRPEFDLFQRAFDDYLINSVDILTFSLSKSRRICQNSTLRNRFNYISDAMASRDLQIGIKQIHQLTVTGDIQGKVINNKRVKFYVNQKDVLKVKSILDGAVDLTIAMNLLGTTKPSVHSLIENQLIDTFGDHIGFRTQRWIISSKSISSLIERINNIVNVIVDNNSEEMMKLSQLCRKSTKLGFNLGLIIEKVLNGEIPCYRNDSGEFSLDSLLVPTNAFNILRAEFLATNHFNTLPEFAHTFCVKQYVAVRWLNIGLIQPTLKIGNASYFSQVSVSNFKHEFITTKEVANLLGVGVLTIQKWARMGRLKPISGRDIDGCHENHFIRSEIELFSKQNRLTAPQMAKRLCISRSQICARIHQGKITPVSGPGIDNCGHYLFIADR